MPHYRGKNVEVDFASVDVTGDGRSVSYEQTADVLDDTVYGADEKTKIASLEDGSFSLEMLDSTGAWGTAFNALAAGATGTVVIRPEGTGAGLRTVTFTGVITSRSLEFPYDDLAKISVSGEISGAVVEGVQA